MHYIFNLKNLVRAFFISVIIILALGIYVFFIEPYNIQIIETDLSIGANQKVVVISDMHLGQWKGRGYLEQVVKKINNIPDISTVLIAGDFTNYPNISEMDNLFAPLSDIKVPVFAVLGNHDVERPGPKLRDELTIALEKANVKLLQNEVVEFQNLKIVGLGDNFAKEDDVEILKTIKTNENVIVLTHNPDTARKYKNNQSVDITFAGHTHCGQVRIPFIYGRFLPVVNNDGFKFDKGYYPDYKTFVTCGIGEIGLPIRFLAPPTIDIIKL